MVVVSSLRYQYGSDKALSFPDFSVEKGKTCLLLGNSGSGKTTLLHLMGGLLKIQQGKVEISDQDLSQLTEPQADRFRGKYMGFIFQRNHLILALSVKKNLLMAPFLANMKQDEIRVDEVLWELGLWKKKHSRVSDLSQGQVQRVAIARAVLNKPAVLFADEPTSALDDYNCDRVIHLLLSVSEQNQCTLVVATHDQRLKSIFPRQVQIQNQ
ncbi:MAG: ATP-binding cassette domain-containing protein [Cyclobacteriaceae bacterium]